MRIVVYGPDKRVGAMVGSKIVDLSLAYSDLVKQKGSGVKSVAAITPVLVDLIELGPAGLEAAQKAIEHAAQAPGPFVVDASRVKLHAPWPRRRMAMCASNYAGHIAGIQKNIYGKSGGIAAEATAAEEMRKAGQFGFWKMTDEVAASDDPIPYPKWSKLLDYEGEVAIVLGKRGKDIKADEIDQYVWGVTLINDWTIREKLQQRALQYNLIKNFDGSCTMGPCIVVGEHDFRNIDVQTRVNGSLRQDFNSRDMVFSFGEIVEHLARDFTFLPGDIISGGTGAGTVQDTTPSLPDGSRPAERFLKVGDVVEISSPQIGAIRNKLVSADSMTK